MLTRLRKSAENKDSGFTLIELLVVMIIIGILAAIAIPAFLSQRTKAREASAKSDVSTIGKEIATYYVDGNSALTATTTPGTGAAPGTWALATTGMSPVAVTSGTHSKSNRILAQTITSSSAWCVVVQSGHADNGAAGTSTDLPWRYNQAGLTQAAAC